MKRCIQCGEKKSLTDFPSNGNGTLRPECKDCRNANRREGRSPGNDLARARKLLEMLEDAGIAIEQIGKVDKLKLYQQGYKDADGQGQVQTLASLHVQPRDFKPKWEPVDAPPVTVPKPPKRKSPKSKTRTAIVLPDMQGGFFLSGGKLEPMHDPKALEVVYLIAQDLVPDEALLHGDNLDFPNFSTKYLRSPAYAGVMRPTVLWGNELCGTLRSLVSGRIAWLAGNHEERLANFLLLNALELYDLRSANQADDDWPLLSVPYLLNMEKFGVEYIEGYPANKIWVNDRLQVIHGEFARNNPGSTAAAYLKDATKSTLYGHIHRREWAESTRETSTGPRTIMAASAGCLCRIDGVVPSFHSGISQRAGGAPIQNWENWQQGFAVVTYEPGDAPFSVEMVPIHDGVGYFRGERYAAA